MVLFRRVMITRTLMIKYCFSNYKICIISSNIILKKSDLHKHLRFQDGVIRKTAALLFQGGSSFVIGTWRKKDKHSLRVFPIIQRFQLLVRIVCVWWTWFQKKLKFKSLLVTFLLKIIKKIIISPKLLSTHSLFDRNNYVC